MRRRFVAGGISLMLEVITAIDMPVRRGSRRRRRRAAAGGAERLSCQWPTVSTT